LNAAAGTRVRIGAGLELESRADSCSTGLSSWHTEILLMAGQ